MKFRTMENEYDLIVIGGGAAGLTAARAASRRGLRVALLERMEKPARKVRITGKGRCNLTNERPREEFLAQLAAHADFFAPAFDAFGNRATMRFFEKSGVKLVTERGERVFPRSGKAWDVADALVEQCEEAGTTILCHCRVQEILTVNRNRVRGVSYTNRKGFARRLEAPAVILATGGASYPTTGSTGDGYRLAHELGHTIVPVRPSLVPLETSYPQIGLLDGLLLRNIRATLRIDDEPAGEEFGEIGFSSRGVEGAVALRLSRRAVDALIDGRRVELTLDLKPALDRTTLIERIVRETNELPENAFVGDLLRKLAPQKLVGPLALAVGLGPKRSLKELSPDRRERLIESLKFFRLPISDYRPFEEAVVTAGGVSVAEVDPDTMQSRLVRGLYFAGEILDLDANTGGYNLQIAFSTGYLAGQLKS